MALRLRGGGHISDAAIYGGAGLTLVDAVGEFIYPELVVADAKDKEGLGVNPNYTFRLHDKLPAPKSRVWFHATRNSGAFLACTGLYLALLTPTAPGTTTPALDRADAFGLTALAVAAAMLRFALANPMEEGFRRVPRVGVVAWPLLLAAAALA